MDTYIYIHETSRKRVQGTFLRAETACGRAVGTGIGGRREGGGWEEKQEPRKMSEKNSNMPRNSGGRAWNASEPLDCASVAYFSRTSDIAPASSSLYNCVRH